MLCNHVYALMKLQTNTGLAFESNLRSFRIIPKEFETSYWWLRCRSCLLSLPLSNYLARARHFSSCTVWRLSSWFSFHIWYFQCLFCWYQIICNYSCGVWWILTIGVAKYEIIVAANITLLRANRYSIFCIKSVRWLYNNAC